MSCWLAANKLSLNVKKSNFLHFHHGKTNKKNINLKINNTPVEEKQSTKYLGTLIDNKLTWKNQIQQTKTKIAKGIGMITKIRHFLGNDTCLKNLYYSFIQSHINYNLVNWSCTYPSYLEPIEKKIKKAVRLISFSKTKFDHTPPLFRKHGILPFSELITYKKAIFMWRSAHNFAPVSLTSSLFTKNQHNPTHFILPFPSNEKDKNSFEYSCVKTWSNVPEALKLSSTLNTFTSKLKHLLISKI